MTDEHAPMVMALCESALVNLRPDQIYRFEVIEDCDGCAEAARKAEIPNRVLAPSPSPLNQDHRERIGTMTETALNDVEVRQDALRHVANIGTELARAEHAVALARELLADAMHVALAVGAPKDAVAVYAGVTPSAMYKSLRKVYGPRKGGTE